MLLVIVSGTVLMSYYLTLLSLFKYPSRPYLRHYVTTEHKGTNGTIQLLDFMSVEFLSDPGICSFNDGSSADTVIVVHSHPSRGNIRATARKYFPADLLKEMGMKRVFVMGVAENGQEKYPDVHQTEIRKENAKSKDIVQGNFMEHYHIKTLKHILCLEWFLSYCPKASYVIKMDDDTAMDFLQVHYELLPNAFKNGDDRILGYMFQNTTPYRNSDNKHFVTRSEFRGDFFPDYLSGIGYLTSRAAAVKLMSNQHTVPFFKIDDVFVTGILAEKYNIKRIGLNTKYVMTEKILNICTKRKVLSYNCDFIACHAHGNQSILSVAFEHIHLRYKNTFTSGIRTHSPQV